jgi:hypothetical protein
MTLPAWVRKRDGTLVPFDPDKISRALFAAGESLGRPDAFLARELTDGVVHFLAAETADRPPTVEQIEECITKTVRELGHPALAQAFVKGAPPRGSNVGVEQPNRVESARLLTVPVGPAVSRQEFVAACMRAFSLEHVFSPDLVAAHRDGLLTLTGLESPFELAGSVLDPDPAPSQAVARARRQAGVFVAADGPEYLLRDRPDDVQRWVGELCFALQGVGLTAIVNLNSAVPPSWAYGGADGPLFTDSAGETNGASAAAFADELLSALLDAIPTNKNLEIQWHLAEPDFVPPSSRKLWHIVERALAGAPISFAFDRPRLPPALAAGLDRRNPTELLTVRLNLAALAAQVSGHPDGAAQFLHKIGSAVRLVLSAGVQKREFLRKQGFDKYFPASGFLVERARLMFAPVGLNEAVTRIYGRSPAESADALEFAGSIVERLRDEIVEDSRTRHLAVGLDGSRLTALIFRPPEPSPGGMKEQSRTAGALSAAADLTTVTLEVLEGSATNALELIETLQWLWKRTPVRRIQLSIPDSQRQLILDS